MHLLIIFDKKKKKTKCIKQIVRRVFEIYIYIGTILCSNLVYLHIINNQYAYLHSVLVIHYLFVIH